MQAEKTLKFWDDFHDQVVDKEWILPPSDALLKCIASQFPAKTDHIRVLEIGCGTSSLSFELCDFWERVCCEKNFPDGMQAATASSIQHLNILATDVSKVCIELQQKRLSDQTLQRKHTTLQYQVFNITEPQPTFNGAFDVILDKGCLDTCLFRSKKANQWVEKVLHNLHSWLSDNGDSVYCVVTPRTKLKAVRDFAGFDVVRTVLPAGDYGTATIQARSGVNPQEFIDRLYLYSCRYRKMTMEPSVGETKDIQQLAGRNCRKCGLSFEVFCRSTKKKNRTDEHLKRHWMGHQRHCKPGIF